LRLAYGTALITHTARDSLRIAQVAPLYESVPPALYGGTERVVSYLTEALVTQGHRVTLFASGDSKTKANLVSVCERAIRLDPENPNPLALHVVMIEEVFQRASEFDAIHFHVDGMHLPLARRHSVPMVTTLHGRLDLPGLDALYREFSEQPLVSISNAQREPLEWANWIGTVYHGIPAELHRPSYNAGQYFAFLGRISPEKRVDRAVAIARRGGIPLKIAAKIDTADREYFTSVIEPLIDGTLIQYVGEIDEREKTEFLGNAIALLFPVDWPEPFGLSMIEAMACGTPVIAFRCGSVPEVIDVGVTGYVVDNLEQAVDCAELVQHLDRRSCRETFERRFSAMRMAQDYCAVYKQLGEKRWLLKA
jgi:glycosyltransferase involved in cell wall biosynthesis